MSAGVWGGFEESVLGWEEGSLSGIDIGGLGGLVALVWCVHSQDNSSGGGAFGWYGMLN